MNIYIDIDGVLAYFDKSKSLEEITRPGYFKNVKPRFGMIKAVKQLCKIAKSEGFTVNILSACINHTAAGEKYQWLEEHMDFLHTDNIYIVPYGMSKAEALEKNGIDIGECDVLVDDFTQNLNEWPGIGIKFINTINNTNKSWKGCMVNGNADATSIFHSLYGLLSSFKKFGSNSVDENDWRNWGIGTKVYHLYDDKMNGIVTATADDHCIVTDTEGSDYWVDDEVGHNFTSEV